MRPLRVYFELLAAKKVEDVYVDRRRPILIITA